MDKTWAIGLSQEQFVHEFKRRMPNCDVIPDVKEWLAFKHQEREIINLPNADEINPNLDGRDMVQRILENERQKTEENNGETPMQHKVFTCICGAQIKSQIGLWNHQQKCERYANSKVA